MDFLVECSKTIYFHRALSLWLRNSEILPKQKGVLPFSKVVTFTLKTLEFSRKLSILLQFKTKFRPVTKSKWGTVQNIKFSSEVHSRLVFMLEELQFSRKIMKIIDFDGKCQVF